MVLEANFDILGSLKHFYVGLMQLNDFPQELKDQCEGDISTFASHLDTITYDFKMQIARAKLLAGIINDRKGLVSRIYNHCKNDVVWCPDRCTDLTTSSRSGCRKD
jgi:hypothetical protein